MWASLGIHLICCNKWHPRTSEISTSLEIAIGTHFHARYSTKTTQLFLLVDGEACLLLPSLVSLLSDGTVEPENTYSCILKLTIKVWQSQERIGINTNHSYHQHSAFPKSVLNDLTIKLDSVLTNQGLLKAL